MRFLLTDFDNKDVIFIGREGREGKSFESFIANNATVKSFTFVDQKDGPDYLTKLPGMMTADTVVVKTPGCPGNLVPVPYTTPTRVFFACVEQIGAKTVGVTGTKGKSTTASLIAHMIKEAGYPVLLGGNIGVPMLDMLKDATPETILVVELSSYQLAELEVAPDLAVITNLYRDHTDYHGSLDKYWEAKHNIMRSMDASGRVVFNPQTEIVLHWIAENGAHPIMIDPDEKVNMSNSKLIGDHNRLNFLLARAAAEALGIDSFTCNTALNTFTPIRHRLELVRKVRGITYIDDAIASQPEAAIAGITACVREVGPVGCVMLGGQDRDYDFTELVRLLSTLMIPKLVLFPETGQKIKALFPAEYTPEILETTNMTEAVQWAHEHTPSGSVCLLSTASPSYSIWKDFEEKGDLFQAAVMELQN